MIEGEKIRTTKEMKDAYEKEELKIIGFEDRTTEDVLADLYRDITEYNNLCDDYKVIKSEYLHRECSNKITSLYQTIQGNLDIISGRW